MKNLFKKTILTFVLILLGSFSYAQSACKCDGIFGDCSIKCPSGTSPSCEGTWYGGCDCKCNDVLIDQPAPGSFTKNKETECNSSKVNMDKLLKIKEALAYIDFKDINEYDKILFEITSKLASNKEALLKESKYYTNRIDLVMSKVPLDKRASVIKILNSDHKA